MPKTCQKVYSLTVQGDVVWSFTDANNPGWECFPAIITSFVGLVGTVDYPQCTASGFGPPPLGFWDAGRMGGMKQMIATILTATPVHIHLAYSIALNKGFTTQPSRSFISLEVDGNPIDGCISDWITDPPGTGPINKTAIGTYDVDLPALTPTVFVVFANGSINSAPGDSVNIGSAHATLTFTLT